MYFGWEVGHSVSILSLSHTHKSSFHLQQLLSLPTLLLLLSSPSRMSDSASSLPTFASCIVTDAPDQRTIEGIQAPFVVSPPSTSSPSSSPGSESEYESAGNTSSTSRTISTPHDVVRFVRTYRTEIDHALNTVGAVLFRGFPLQTSEDFDTFVEAFEGWTDLSYDRSMSFAVRKRLTNRICTTNEGKSGGLVFHHEQAQTPLWPSHVFFCCLLPAQPGDGGATGIVSSALVYEKLRAKYPTFCDQCEQYGVRYTVHAGPEQDPTKGAGRSWKSFFHATTKEECETKMRAGGWTWEWGVGPNDQNSTSDHTIVLGDDFLKCTTPILDAVKEVEVKSLSSSLSSSTALTSSDGGVHGDGDSINPSASTKKKCFFNQLIATTANALEFSKVGISGGGYDPLHDVPTQDAIDSCVRFGNGDSIPLEILLDAKRMCEELAIDVQWERGDVALISNYLMMHARRPWNGPEGTRQLLASLVAEENCTSFGEPLVAL
jgi:alpha-ketoglutarate-dependent taurine dioxygenase